LSSNSSRSCGSLDDRILQKSIARRSSTSVSPDQNHLYWCCDCLCWRTLSESVTDTHTHSDPYPTLSLPKGSLYLSTSTPEPLSRALDHYSCLGLCPLQYLHLTYVFTKDLYACLSHILSSGWNSI